MDAKRLWTIGAVLAMVVVVAAGWFLGIQPQLTEASTASQNLATAQTQNAAAANSLAKLKADHEGIAELKKSVESLRQSVPSSAQLSAFVTELDLLGGEHQVEVKSISVSDAKPYTPPAPVAVAPAPGTPAAPTASPSPSPSSAPVASAPMAPTAPAVVTNPRITAANFVAIPVALKVSGTYSKVLDFVKGLQAGERLFLVTTFATTELKDPTSAASQVSASVGGLVYVLLDNGANTTGAK